MPGLTQQQIELINAQVTAEGITFSHLHDELVDHICCMTEDFMHQGLSFDEAYGKTGDIIGHKGIKKVQENTLLLIDKKYRLMKNTMKIVGWGAMALMTTGALFKIQHWPGASILLVLGFFLLGAIFTPTALWVMKKESKLKGSIFIFLIAIVGSLALIFGILFKIQHWPGAGILITFGYTFLCGILLPGILINKLLDPTSKHLRLTYVIGYFALSFYAMGTLFKIMHWPGAAIMLLLGAILLTTVFFPMYVSKVYLRSDSVKPGFLYFAVALVFFNMFNLLLAINVSKDVMNYFVNPGTELIHSNSAMAEYNDNLTFELLDESQQSPNTDTSAILAVSTSADALCAYIDTLKVEIVVAADMISEEEAWKIIPHPTAVMYKNDTYAPAFVLYGLNGEKPTGKVHLLKQKMSDYNNSLQSICKDANNVVPLISDALSTSEAYINGYGESVSWDMYHFNNIVTIAALNKLSMLNMQVRIAEGLALDYLNN